MGRSRRFVVLIAIAAVCVVACGTPAPSPSPTLRPSPTPVPGPTLAPGVTLNVMARNVEFKPNTLDVPAGRPFIVRLINADLPDMPHDLDIRRADGTTLADREPIPGNSQREFLYDALPAGDYVFICSIHPIPAMTGTLRVR